jgi:hypothetical protein
LLPDLKSPIYLAGYVAPNSSSHDWRLSWGSSFQAYCLPAHRPLHLTCHWTTHNQPHNYISAWEASKIVQIPLSDRRRNGIMLTI